MSEQPQPIHSSSPTSTESATVLALGHQPPSFWVASLASLAVIVGGVAPWATYLNYVSISGTSMHGWREVVVGACALVLLGIYQLRKWRLVMLVTALLGVLGVIGAIGALHSITSGGAVNVFGVTYRYLTAAWGIYLVLVGTIILTLAASALAWEGARAWLGQFRSRLGADVQRP